MPTPPAHNRIIVYGVSAQPEAAVGSDTWEFTMADASALTPTALATALLPVIHAAWTSSGVDIAQAARLGGVRVEAIDASGAVTSSYNAAQAGNVIGLNTNQQMTILSHCITLETAAVDARGTRIRGRFYPPATAADIIGASSTDADTLSYLTAWRLVLHNMNAAGAVLCVASQTGVGLATVTGASCDNVVDTQRRRKNNLTPVRQGPIAL